MDSDLYKASPQFAAFARVPILQGLRNYWEWRKAAKNAAAVAGVEDVLKGILPASLGASTATSVTQNETTAAGGDKTPTPPAIVGSSVEMSTTALQRYRIIDQRLRAALEGVMSTYAQTMVKTTSTTAQELWESLPKALGVTTDRFEKEVFAELGAIRFTMLEDRSAFMDRFNLLMMKMEMLGMPTSPKTKASHFINSLPGKLDYVRSEFHRLPEDKQILVSALSLFNEKMDNLSADRDAKEEKLVLFNRSRSTTMPGARNPGVCYNCGKPGHYALDCRSKKNEAAVARARAGQPAREAHNQDSRARNPRPRGGR